MSVLYVLLPLALLFSGLAVATFVWAVRKGQFDDLETPSMRILEDDDTPPTKRPAQLPAQLPAKLPAQLPVKDAKKDGQ